MKLEKEGRLTKMRSAKKYEAEAGLGVKADKTWRGFDSKLFGMNQDCCECVISAKASWIVLFDCVHLWII